MRKILFPAIFLVLILVLAACGGDDDSDTSAGSTGTGTTTTTTSASGEAVLTSSGLSFKFQYSCINRTLDPCVAASMEGGFADRVRERTNGQVEIEISSFPELGLAGPDTLRLLEDGTLGMAEIYSGYIGGDLPIVDISNLWGLYPDYATHIEIIQATRDDLFRIVSERAGGAKVLGYQLYPNNFYFANKPLRTREDFKGMKTRSHSTVLGDLIDGMGADAQFVAFSEVYTALERGILDTAVSCGTCGSGLRWYEVSKYLVGPIVALGHSWVTINGDRWAEMPADIQAIIQEEATRHEALTLKNATGLWDQNGIDENVANGMEYIEFNDELVESMRQAAISKVLPNWIERAGGPDSEAAQIYNDKVAPLLRVRVLPDGTAEEY